MIDEPRWPLSEETQPDEQRRCALCVHFFPKDEMHHVQVDEAQNWRWVCEGCNERELYI